MRISKIEILNDISDGIVSIDQQWHIIYSNHRANQILQSESCALLGRSILEATSPDDNLLREEISSAFSSQQDRCFEYYSRKQGAWFEIKLYPVQDRLSIRFIEIKYHDAKSAPDLPMPVMPLLSMMDSANHLLSLVSHDLCTPLAAMKMRIQSAEKSIREERPGAYAPDKIRMLVQFVGDGIEELGRVIDGLLLIANLREGTVQSSPIEMDLGALAKEIASRFDVDGSQINCELKGNWDPDLIGHAVSMAFDFATKASQKNPLSAQAGQDALNAWLKIEIASDYRELWSFSSKSHYETANSGLGLYALKEVVATHGGSIELKNDTESGMALTLRFPKNQARSIFHDSMAFWAE